MPSTPRITPGSRGAAQGPLADRVVEAYGGEERWRAATQIDVHLDAGGLLFRWKRGRGFRGLHMRADVWEPRISMDPFYKPGQVGILEGLDVRVETTGGQVLESRQNARSFFPYGRRFIWWDKLDMAYFFGFALWNYLTLPALILRDDIQWRELSDTQLEATFPDHIATHCAVAKYHFDPATSLLERYDYTSHAFGRWAVANHMTPEHRTNDEGIPFASRREVRPEMPGGDKPMPFPLLIWADVHDFKLGANA
jgi:hypothetical protein